MTSVAPAIRTASAELAEFCLRIRWADLSGEEQDRVRELVLDLLGVAIAGSRAASSRPVVEVAQRLGGQGRASLIGGRGATSAVWAALANGTAAHAIEMDDVTTESSLHPGVAVIPAALALAEELDSSPTAFLEAVVAGYEVTMRVGNALNPASAYARGFHPTGVAGTFGAAMAACRLLGLDVERSTHALGIAGTLTSGSLEYLSDGAWTKRLNPGWAGHAGITAALLARAGFTGPASVFEGRLGVLHAFYRRRLTRAAAGGPRREPLQIMRVSIKPYACCRYNHGLIDCVLALAREHQLRAGGRGAHQAGRAERRRPAGRRADRTQARARERGRRPVQRALRRGRGTGLGSGRPRRVHPRTPAASAGTRAHGSNRVLPRPSRWTPRTHANGPPKPKSCSATAAASSRELNSQRASRRTPSRNRHWFGNSRS